MHMRLGVGVDASFQWGWLSVGLAIFGQKCYGEKANIGEGFFVRFYHNLPF